MTEDNEVRGLLRLQRILTTTVIASFGITIPIYLWNKELGSDACYISMLLLVASAPIRLGWISRHFRKRGHRKTYLIAIATIALIVLSALFRFTR